MKRIAALALLAGCSAPAPLVLPDEPERAEARVVADDLLKKDALTLDDALRIAERLNPDLEIERREIDLATAALWEAQLYPNPSLVAEVEDDKIKAGVRVPIVLSGRIGAATDAAEKDREAAALRYVWRKREILADVKRAYVELLAARREADLATETRDLARTLHDATKVRFEAQAIPEMELLKAAVNLAKAETDLRQATKRAKVGLKALHALLGDTDFPRDRFVGELPARFVVPDLATLRTRVLGGHPLLEAEARAREAAEFRLSQAERERIPDVAFEITAGRDRDEDETIVEGGIEIPLPIFQRNQAKIADAQIRIRQARLRSESVRNELLLRLAEAHEGVTAAQERVTVYRDEILPKATKALEQTNEGYRVGKYGFLDVLDAQRTLAEAKSAYTAALEELNLAAADLETIAGIRLEVAK